MFKLIVPILLCFSSATLANPGIWESVTVHLGEGKSIDLPRTDSTYTYAAGGVVFALAPTLDYWYLDLPLSTPRQYVGLVDDLAGSGLLEDSFGNWATVTVKRRSWLFDVKVNPTWVGYGFSSMLLVDLFCITLAAMLKPIRGLVGISQ